MTAVDLQSGPGPGTDPGAGSDVGAVKAVEVAGLCVAYGDNLVLDGLDFTVLRGEVVVFLGPNGAGKTTAIEIFEGLRTPSSGRVKVLGATPWEAGEAWRARVGAVLQSWRDHAKWRVGEFLDYLGSYYRPFSTAEVPRPWPIPDLLRTVGLAEEESKRIGQLSGGKRRRLDVAAGLVGRPEILFLDEPTAGFDPLARRGFHDVIQSLADDRTTILMTTHDLGEAEEVASRILVLAERRIIADGSPDQLRRLDFGQAEVRWSDGAQRHVHATSDATGFLRELLSEGGRVEDLEVRRATLEDAYIGLVRQAEGGTATDVQRNTLAILDAAGEGSLA